MSHSHGNAIERHSYGQAAYHTLLHHRVAHLRDVENRMDDLFQQVLQVCSEREISDAVERLDTLVMAYPELRLTSQLRQHPDETWRLMSQLDLDRGPLLGFEAAMGQLCELCLTPQAMHRLRSKMYTVTARVAQERPELLPTAAIAALSLDPVYAPRTMFTEMVICASAIEWLADVVPDEDGPISLDVSTWLAAEPSEYLLAAVGEERAYYYASIPGVLPFLNPQSVLFDIHRLLPDTKTTSERNAERYPHLLGDLADRQYQRRLRAEIERAQGTLRQRHPAASIADVEMLVCRALEALDDLPPQVNPLLQAIWVQSWVQCLHELCE